MRAFVNLTTTFMPKSTPAPLSQAVCASASRGTPPHSPSSSKSTSPSGSPPPTSPSVSAEYPASSPPAPGRRRMPVFYSPEFKNHRPPPGSPHPECPARLDACVSALKNAPDLAPLIDWTAPIPVSGPDHTVRRERVLAAIKDVHTFPDYFDKLQRITKQGGGGLDSDTYVSPNTYEVALLAVSTWMEAVDTVLDDGKKVAWALTRPPGHHATKASGQGFCIFSNAAIAAKYALNHKGVSSVAILDIDVHHGNGSEDAVKNEENIRFASSHQWPLYPRSGPEGTSGRFDNILNLNLKEGTGLDVYKSRYEEEMLPFLLNSEAGMPDLVIVSAGYDALEVDPLASLSFMPSDYKIFTELLFKAVSEDTKVIFGLEGGYDLSDEGIGAAVRETIAGYCLSDPSGIPELEEAPQVL